MRLDVYNFRRMRVNNHRMPPLMTLWLVNCMRLLVDLQWRRYCPCNIIYNAPPHLPFFII
ncbi:hypothetical protein Scep_022603 [Stephania cephalantha]|uniref:Uncharacterized protein n=1 Tax=Stephania cephalantha TaxID=152367 RepID=A0AAP0FI95_9MAGN